MTTTTISQEQKQQKQKHPPPKRKKQVCLFGISGDPPTGMSGHVGIVSYLSSLDYLDEIRVLPVYIHMFSEKRGKQASFDERLAMCQIAFRDIPKVLVSDQERICFDNAAAAAAANATTVETTNTTTLPKKSIVRIGTADLIEHLQSTEQPTCDFYLALGRDTFMDLTNWKWRRSKDILFLIEGRMIVIDRLTTSSEEEESDGDDDVRLVELIERVIMVNQIVTPQQPQQPPLPDMSRLIQTLQTNGQLTIGRIQIAKLSILSNVSSTLVRATTDDVRLGRWLSPVVLDYIKRKRMYAFGDVGKEDEE